MPSQMQCPATWSPSIAVLLTTELIASLLIILATIGLIVPTMNTAEFKAESTELFVHLGARRADIVEHYALTGEWLGSDPETGKIASDLSLSTNSKNVRLEFVNGSVVATGTLQRFGEFPFRLSFRPAVANDAYHRTVIWLCGNEAVPPGFVSPSLPVPYGLPVNFPVSLCSEGFRQ
jgi:hypothetical protein